MGAIEPLRWHSWHRACKIGATSLVNVTDLAASFVPVLFDISAAVALPANATNAQLTNMPFRDIRIIRDPPSEPSHTAS
jgi:hypothetical protein